MFENKMYRRIIVDMNIIFQINFVSKFFQHIWMRLFKLIDENAAALQPVVDL